MTEAKKILSMIEVVDPADTAKLDEIDARVWCWRNRYKFSGPIEAREESVAQNGAYVPRRIIYKSNGKRTTHFTFYTRSRDALKAIRPEGWYMHTVQHGGDFWVSCTLSKKVNDNFSGSHFETTGVLYPTEELAELHAIIQAIAYEMRQI